MLFRLDADRFFLIVNAINVKTDLDWMEQHLQHSVGITDVTDDVPMVAVQGPNALGLLQKLTGTPLSPMRRLHVRWMTLLGRQVLLSRTGYTGEDGFEIYAFQGDEARRYVIDLWNTLLRIGEEYQIEPCGLVARDTLRLEAGFCLNGNELGEDVTPLEAGLGYGVKFDDRSFIGKDALLTQSEMGVEQIRTGFKMVDKGIPRKGMELAASTDGEPIGHVTSGTYSPLLKAGIGMGYVPPTYSAVGEKLTIHIRGRKVGAEVVTMPFYDEEQYGWRRKRQ
jgi:aminomethyltransferase